jgi:hypothetical protein
MEEVLAVLAWLAQGAVEYLGGLAMKAILGNPDLKDIESVVRAAVNEINAATRQAIDENEIRKLVASMSAIFKNLHSYADFPTRKDQLDNQFLLQDAITKTEDAASQCESLGIPAVFCFANAISLNLLAKAAYYKLHGTTNAKQEIQSVVKDSSATMSNLVSSFIGSLDPSKRLSIPNPPCRWEPDSGNGSPGKCWVTIDGQEVVVFDSIGPIDAGEYNALVSDQRTQLQQFRDQAISQIQMPLEKVAAAWQSAVATAMVMSLGTIR